MTAITCSGDTLAITIAALRAGGERDEERVVLWLARAPSPHGRTIEIVEVHEPAQVAGVDFFELPPDSMRALIDHLRSRRLKIAAQVHTHPGHAFHSEADARWAVVRHVGALSLVLPRFARGTTPENFLQEAATFELTMDDGWSRVPSGGRDGRIGVRP